MHKVKGYAERIRNLSRKIDWEMVKIRCESAESYQHIMDTKKELQEVQKELEKVYVELQETKQELAEKRN